MKKEGELEEFRAYMKRARKLNENAMASRLQRLQELHQEGKKAKDLPSPANLGGELLAALREGNYGFSDARQNSRGSSPSIFTIRLTQGMPGRKVKWLVKVHHFELEAQFRPPLNGELRRRLEALEFLCSPTDAHFPLKWLPLFINAEEGVSVVKGELDAVAKVFEQ